MWEFGSKTDSWLWSKLSVKNYFASLASFNVRTHVVDCTAYDDEQYVLYSASYHLVAVLYCTYIPHVLSMYEHSISHSLVAAVTVKDKQIRRNLGKVQVRLSRSSLSFPQLMREARG